MKRLPRIGSMVQYKPPAREVRGLYEHNKSVGKVVAHYANGLEVDVLWEDEAQPLAIEIAWIQYAKKASNP